MKCDDLLKILNEYVDGEIDPGVCRQFEQHLTDCDPCQVVVDNIRKTITVFKNGQPYELPVPFRKRLHSILQQNWKQKFEKQ